MYSYTSEVRIMWTGVHPKIDDMYSDMFKSNSDDIGTGHKHL